MLDDLYISGEYLEKNPTWHVEDSPWKARQITRMIANNNLVPKTICEVGCGAGDILKQLQVNMDRECTFWGMKFRHKLLSFAKAG